LPPAKSSAFICVHLWTKNFEQSLNNNPLHTRVLLLCRRNHLGSSVFICGQKTLSKAQITIIYILEFFCCAGEIICINLWLKTNSHADRCFQCQLHHRPYSLFPLISRNLFMCRNNIRYRKNGCSSFAHMLCISK
jgi:hypothetical protein